MSPILAAQQSLSSHAIKLPLDDQVRSDPERRKDIVRVAYEQLVGFGITRNSRNRVRGTGISLAADHTDRHGADR